jgi:hypothetical protein
MERTADRCTLTFEMTSTLPSERCALSSAVAHLVLVRPVHWFRRYRWWILLPLFLAILVPAWQQLAFILQYDLYPAPDPAPSRFESAWIGLPFYFVWYVIMFFVLLPATAMASAFRRITSIPIPYRMLPALVGLLYCCVFCLLRRSVFLVVRFFRSRDASPKI